MIDKVHENKLQILGKLAATLTHEIKNPLSVLKLNLDYLKLGKDNYDAETNECIESSIEAADLINQLVYNTLEFSKKNEDSFSYCDLNSIVKKSLKIMKGHVKTKAISLQLELSDDLTHITGNEINLVQVFINIISNSIEASNKGSKIIIRTYSNLNNVCAEVIDEGKGINKNEIEKIFDEFYTKKNKGTGLGLSICKTILNKHNAKFSITNNKVKGTKVKIEFSNNI
ncbi:MAG: hypothetical protein CR986_01635 [Ignavibacteriae bacterium]|nr:MAG: hypothetical protein CR986_01635 [Ignavibacteriota bacterium]